MKIDFSDRVLSQLAGDWSFTRSVSTGQGMKGTAIFSAAADRQLRYVETGMLTLADGKAYAFERRYLYDFNASCLRVLFDESPPRLFQTVDLTEGVGALVGTGFHNCAPDTYASTYRFSLPGQFRITHDVTGPRKAYCIITDYARSAIGLSELSKECRGARNDQA